MSLPTAQLSTPAPVVPAAPAPAAGSSIAPSGLGAFSHAICIRKVEGGEKTNPLWMSKVDNEGFRTALTNSMDRAGLLAPANGCKYPLDVNLLGISEPSMGFSMTAKSNVNYKLYDNNVQPVMLETISASYTAKMSESMIGVVRAKRAIEGAIRESINGFMAKLGKVDVK